MLYGATSKELLKLAIFIMPTFAQANNSGMTQGQTTSSAAESNMGYSSGSSNASSNMGNIGANIGSNNVVVNHHSKEHSL